MADIEPLFPNRPLQPRMEDRPIVAERPMELTRRIDDDPWAAEALIQARAGRRVAWVFACLLIVIVGAQAAAIALMLPLREVVPYVVTVDRQTGYVETTRGVQLGDLKEDRAVVESMLAQYVLARETFDPADFSDRYSRVALWSLGGARDSYVDLYRADRPGNLLSVYRPGTTVRVTVKSIEVLTDTTARIRFETQRRDPGADPVRGDLQSIVSFRFTGQPMKMEDRLMNPLGFQVTGYRRDAETAADSPPQYVPPAENSPGTPPETSSETSPAATLPLAPGAPSGSSAPEASGGLSSGAPQ